jgi:hypothetical protein
MTPTAKQQIQLLTSCCVAGQIEQSASGPSGTAGTGRDEPLASDYRRNALFIVE